MPLPNKVSLDLTEETLTEVMDLARQLDAKLKPLMIALKASDKQHLPKMGDGNLPFVEKSLEYAIANPDFAPRHLDVMELKADVETVKKLLPLNTLLTQLRSGLDDTIMVAGSEALVASLAYYQGVKQAAKANEPGAKPLMEELQKRFRTENSKKAEL